MESVWSRFSSPYDPPDSAGRYRTLSPEPRLLWYKRIARSFPPSSPKMTRSTSLPRGAVHSQRPRRLNFQFLTPPYCTSTGRRTTDDQDVPVTPRNNRDVEEMIRRERRISRSAEILDDDSEFDGSRKEGRRKMWQMCKSSEELEAREAHCLTGLERLRVCGTSRSDDSINVKMCPTRGAGMSVCCQTEDDIERQSSVESTDTLHDDQYYDDDEEDGDTEVEEEEREAGLDHGKEPVVIVVAGNGDHPPITVRPGVSLDKFRSSRSEPGKFVAASHESRAAHKRNRSTSSDLEDVEETFPECDDFGGEDIPEPKSGDTTHRGRKKEHGQQFLDIPQMPELCLAKYNFGERFRRRSMRRGTYQDSLMEAPPPRLPAKGRSCSLSCTGGKDRRIVTDDEVFVTPTLQYPRDHWDNANAGRRSLRLRSARSRSEERGPSLQRSQSMRQQGFRYSAEARIPARLQNHAVVGEDESGICHGLIFNGGTSVRTGVFPASLVLRGDQNVGGMSGRGKPAPVVKKVSPPTVPDNSAITHRHSGSSFSSGVYSAGDQRSSYSSSVSDENPPPSPHSPARAGGGVTGGGGNAGSCDHGQLGRLGTTTTATTTTTTTTDGGGGGGGQPLANSSPSHYHNQQQFTFPNAPHQQQQVPQFAHLMCSKTSPGSPHHMPPEGTYGYLTYQHQTSLEDQGIDVQSPGRSSPGSGSGSSTTGSTASSGGCRNSTTSLDSGRASTTTHSHQHRLSGQSYDSGSILRHSYHSSSSSLGSMEHDNTPHVNVLELLNNGVRDSEVLRAWLTDLRFEEHYDKFLSAGYDMPTISRMTPEDLNAIGVTKPAHRKKLKAEITRLNISDGLPDFIPGRLEDWLSLLRLEEYTTSLKQQKYVSVEQMTQLTWEDLEDIGITKLGHQKKVMLAIKRVKDIMAGKKFTTSQDSRQQPVYGAHEIMIPRDCEGREQFSGVPEFRTFSGSGHYGNTEHNRLSGFPESGVHYGVAPHYNPNLQYGPMPPPQAHIHPMPQHPAQYHQSNQFTAPQGPSPPGSKLPAGPTHPLPGSGQVQYRPDVVAVQVRPGGRGRSIESLEEPIYGTYQTFHPDNRMAGHPQGPMSLGNLPPRPFAPSNLNSSHPQRSMDDGDITPTNEYANNYEGGGTLPRPRTANKLRPVAKVTAKTRADVHEVPQFIKDGMNLKKPTTQGEEICMKELNLKTLNRQNSEKSYSSNQGSGSSNNTPQGTPKKIPPPPPRRSNSISESSKEAASQDNQYGYLRRGLSYGYMGIKNNLQPDVTPDLPPPPAPPDSANHQHLPDDFPPPPPPLTCVTMANATHITASSTITTSSMTSDSLATSQTSTTSSDEDGSTGFRPRRNDSNASFKSTSSTDSESLPFANENAGTIKQRACRPHPGLTVLDTRNSPHSSPRSSPALRRKEAQPPLRQNPIATTDASAGQISKSNSSSPDGTGDVLNDIGNMLANLTDELDAMLEQEVTLKN